ncbi:hypothetical protein JCM10908_005713 [Rhodotorula pacifica]|uniref:uncharacterized protein n=1 Tax=Rhodotorula pacifica TaxID=1495444 RepID=UPI00317776DF
MWHQHRRARSASALLPHDHADEDEFAAYYTPPNAPLPDRSTRAVYSPYAMSSEEPGDERPARARGRARASSLSRLFAGGDHAYDHLKAKQPLSTVSPQYRETDSDSDANSSEPPPTGFSGFSREARHRRKTKRAGSAPALGRESPVFDSSAAAHGTESVVPEARSDSGGTTVRDSTRTALPPPPPSGVSSSTFDHNSTQRASDNQPVIDHPLFAPTFSPRQLRRLNHAAHRLETQERHQLRKGTIGAEVKVAMGVLEILEIEKRNKRKVAGKGEGEEGGRTGMGKGVRALIQGLEGELEHRLDSTERHAASSTNERRGAGIGGAAGRGLDGKEGKGNGEEQLLAGVGGAAAVAGLVGAGYEWWEHHRRQQQQQRAGEGDAAGSTASSSNLSLPSITCTTGSGRTADYLQLPTGATPSPQIPRPLGSSLPAFSSAAAAPPPPQQTPYLSTFTPAQHHLVQHAAAALLLKHHHAGEKTMHDKMHRAIGGFEKMVRVLEDGMKSAWRGAEEHVPGAAGGGASGRRSTKLFGTPLAYLTKHEGVDSLHGADPHGTVRIPEFIDHCIAALMQADVTVEGIFRKSGKLRVVREIMDALDSSGGNDTVIDLAALDPITLADLCKKFLASLPDPIITSHLFKLFIACSHIHNVTMRRRCMHLVICMMPKVNRDVLEVVFLFLEWLSRYAHITVKDGNRMDLTAIATVMAPTLLRPNHRDPKPAELQPMIAAVLSLLEDQHLLHAVPDELAKVLHLQVPRSKGKEHRGLGSSAKAAGFHVRWVEEQEAMSIARQVPSAGPV